MGSREPCGNYFISGHIRNHGVRQFPSRKQETQLPVSLAPAAQRPCMALLHVGSPACFFFFFTQLRFRLVDGPRVLDAASTHFTHPSYLAYQMLHLLLSGAHYCGDDHSVSSKRTFRFILCLCRIAFLFAPFIFLLHVYFYYFNRRHNTTGYESLSRDIIIYRFRGNASFGSRFIPVNIMCSRLCFAPLLFIDLFIFGCCSKSHQLARGILLRDRETICLIRWDPTFI